MEKIYRVQMNSSGMPNFSTAVEVADRPQGEWLVYDDDDYLYTDIKCSACRTGFTVDAYRRMDIGFTIEDLKFCPNCGARMKGADDEV